MIPAGLNDKAEAFRALEVAVEERSDWCAFLKVDPRFDPLRSDARFTGLLRRIGLVP